MLAWFLKVSSSSPSLFLIVDRHLILLASLHSALSNLYVLFYVNRTLKSIYSKYVYDARGERTSKRVRSIIIQLTMSLLTIKEE